MLVHQVPLLVSASAISRLLYDTVLCALRFGCCNVPEEGHSVLLCSLPFSGSTKKSQGEQKTSLAQLVTVVTKLPEDSA